MSPHGLACYTEPFAVGCRIPPPFAGDHTIYVKTNMGTSPPYAYLIPGVGTLTSRQVVPALLSGRLAIALSSMLLLALAAFALWQQGKASLSITGLLAAATPMVMSVGSSITASGPEVVSGVSLFACLLRLSRREQPPRWIWAAAGLSGFLLAVTRQLGPFWVLMQLALFVGLIGLGPAWRRLRSQRSWALGSAMAVFTGAALNAFWQVRYEPHPSLSLDKLSEYYDPGWGDMREMGRHSIGVFGPLDTVLNPGIYFGWTAVLLVLGTIAFLVGTGRHRLLLSGAIALSVCSTLALQTVQASVGFGAQGRQLLPIFVTMPLLSGEVIYRNRQKLAHLRPKLLLWVSITVSVLQGTAWYGVGRRYAMGPREAGLFASDPLFAPPLGWPFWGVVVLAACVMTALFGLAARPGWDDSGIVAED